MNSFKKTKIIDDIHFSDDEESNLNDNDVNDLPEE